MIVSLGSVEVGFTLEEDEAEGSICVVGSGSVAVWSSVVTVWFFVKLAFCAFKTAGVVDTSSDWSISWGPELEFEADDNDAELAAGDGGSLVSSIAAVWLGAGWRVLAGCRGCN